MKKIRNFFKKLNGFFANMMDNAAETDKYLAVRDHQYYNRYTFVH